MSHTGTSVADLLVGYELGGVVGRGASGVVFDGRHLELDRAVAIKQLHPAFGDDPAVRARFVSEARVLASLDHPHIVSVYDFLQRDGLCLLVMEKLTGGTVWERFIGTGLTADRACAVVIATCAALQFAHEHGVLHRDIKPENLLFAATGVLKVTDFGIAKVVGGGETLATRGGLILGTPAYMAPEQALAEEPSAATDVYATGIMLYELLSGRLPFSNDGGPLAVVYRHIHDPPIQLRDVAPTVPAGIAEVVMKAIATKPQDRFPSADAFRIAVSDATTDAWGPSWIGRIDVPVISTAVHPEQAQAPGDDRPTTAGSAVSPGGDGTHPTAQAAATVAAAPAPPTVPVKPDNAARARPTWAGSPAQLDLVPIRVLISAPPLSPAGLILAALGLLLMIVALALVGLGAPPARGTILPGMVALNGFDPAGGGVPRLDLSSPVVVTGTVPPGLKQVRLRFDVMGTSLGSGEVEVHQEENGSFTAPVDVSGARFLVAGKTSARIELTFAGQDSEGFSLYRTFPISGKQPPFVSVPGAVGLALLLFVIGYAESFLRCLRHGDRVRLASIGLVAIGLLAGGLAVDLAWVGGGRQPVFATVLGCTLLGAAAAAVAARAAFQLHRRRQGRLRLGASKTATSG